MIEEHIEYGGTLSMMVLHTLSSFMLMLCLHFKLREAQQAITDREAQVYTINSCRLVFYHGTCQWCAEQFSMKRHSK